MFFLFLTILNFVLDVLREDQEDWPGSHKVFEGTSIVQMNTGISDEVLDTP
jgi:hypothetical protein